VFNLLDIDTREMIWIPFAVFGFLGGILSTSADQEKALVAMALKVRVRQECLLSNLSRTANL
jgi:hypothetical protein